MTSSFRFHVALRAAIAVLALAAIPALAPPPLPSAAQLRAAYLDAHGQRLTVSKAVPVSDIQRASYSATPGIQALANDGTNYDWAKLVLQSGGWPITNSSVTVIVRWMRQENGPPNWWNRDNPLNNGFGSGGNAGTGSFANLIIAAQKAAENLKRNPGFNGIAAAFASSASMSDIQHAIWASPWSTSHYANGTHWSTAPVPVVKAPAGAW
jgi:hypothetical protein